MRVAGMMRLAEIDQSKLGKDLMKYSISLLSEKVSKLYFLQIGNVDYDIVNYIDSLGVPYTIKKSEKDYMSGWMFKNNESLEENYKMIDESFDWVLYPDADDLLPEKILDILKEADEVGAETIRFYFIECFGSKDNVIGVKEGYPIGPHFKAVKWRKDIGFTGSDGFNEGYHPNGLKRFETEWCMRHLRYANPEGIEERKKMNYFQEYFLENHELIPYQPNQKFNYYKL
jgi:hypothetical protein